MDYLNFSKDPIIKKLLDIDDKVVFSKKVSKYNSLQWRQERNMMITKKYLYNLKGKTEKRKISLEKINAITKSENDKAKQFVLHITSEYDYHYEADSRDEIINLLRENYWHIHNENIKIYVVPEDNLAIYVTTKNDARKTQSKIPDSKYLLIEEDKDDVGNDELPQNLKGELLYTNSNTVELSSFQATKLIMRSVHESIFLVKKIDTKETLMMKITKRVAFLDTENITSEFVAQEAEKNKSNPFLLHPEFIYRDKNRLYILFKPVYENSLAQILQKEKRMSERKACFFSYQIAFALMHLHEKDTTYGCLNPENVFVDENYYICLNDFGSYRFMTPENRIKYIESLSKNNSYYKQTLPPEYFTDHKLNADLDWWSFGILLYELITGITPFYSSNPNVCEQSILVNDFTFPSPLKCHILITDITMDFINRLLYKEPKDRLCKSILDNQFFKGKGWTHDQFLNKQVNTSCIFLDKTIPNVEPALQNILKCKPNELISELYPSETGDELYKKMIKS